MKTIQLSRRYTVGSSVFDTLSLRAPRLVDYRRHGPVAERQRDMVVTYPAAIWGYAESLVQDIPPGALNELDLEDAFALEDAIAGFFTDANTARRARLNSSSGSAGDEATSTV